MCNYTESKLLKKHMTKQPISDTFKNAYSDYWMKYLGESSCRSVVRYACYYAFQNAILDSRYIPNDLCYTKID